MVLDDGLDEVEESTCFYIDAYVDGHLLGRTMVDSRAVTELINPSVVKDLALKTYDLEAGWFVRVADSQRILITQFVIIQVVVSGIRTHLRAFVMALREAFDLLLSRHWMSRVRAIENHEHYTLTI